MVFNAEETYNALILEASDKYASWDPEITLKVGDWGKLLYRRRLLLPWGRGVFVKEGNIYDDKDGKARKYGIKQPKEYAPNTRDGIHWITSQNASEISRNVEVGVGILPDLAACEIKAGYEVSSGRGAILVMINTSIIAMTSLVPLRQLLKAESSMQEKVIVTEVHQCSSYARILTSRRQKKVFLGLLLNAGGIFGRSEGKWLRNGRSGNFKSNHNGSGKRIFTPLYKLESVKTL